MGSRFFAFGGLAGVLCEGGFTVGEDRTMSFKVAAGALRQPPERFLELAGLYV
jgi:hypothetical protein